MSDNYQLYTQDYLQEDEDICDICKNVKNHDDLEEVETDDRGGTAIVCKDCIREGWPEENDLDDSTSL